ncbi:MAG: hypothetical protein ACE5KM_15925 [Planctomycetaceae bacterium]
MAIPAIGATQILQLGAAAASLGPVVSRTFADLLKSAAELIAPEPEPATPSAGAGPAARNDEFAVLQKQIADLLSRFTDRLKRLLRGRGPEEGPATPLEVAVGSDGTLRVFGNDAPQSADVANLVADDETLATLFRQIVARKQLLSSATAPSAGPLRGSALPGAVVPRAFTV